MTEVCHSVSYQGQQRPQLRVLFFLKHKTYKLKFDVKISSAAKRSQL